MHVVFKIALLGLCSVGLLLVAWRFILPLGLMFISGVGVEVPLPRRLSLAFPKLAIFLFTFGGPLIFLGLIVAFICLLRTHTTP